MPAVSRTRKAPPIIDLQDYAESINLLVYGDSGSGKTVFAGTAEDALFLSTETGTISAKRQGSKAQMWPIKHMSDMQDAYRYLEAGDHKYRWVLIDSITQLQEMAMRDQLASAIKLNASRDPDIPAIQDYQKVQNQLKGMVLAFNDLPYNVLWTALPMRKEDEEGEQLVLPLITGGGYALSQSICGQMHIVAFLKNDTIKGKDGKPDRTRRSLLFNAAPPYFAKDRYGILGRARIASIDETSRFTVSDLESVIGETITIANPAAESTPELESDPIVEGEIIPETEDDSEEADPEDN